MADVMDTVVRGGTLVTERGLVEEDLGIVGERVAQIGGSMRGRAELDGRGTFVVPAAIDPHVHLSTPAMLAGAEPTFADDMRTGTLAAIAGGVGTVGQMSFPLDGETVGAAVARDRAAFAEQATTDFLLHPSLVTVDEASLDELAELGAAGHSAYKMVMPAFDWDGSRIIESIRRAAEAGMVVMIHCEDEAIVRAAGEQLERAGMTGVEHYPASRPVLSERAAVERAVAIAEFTGATIDVVHCSSAAALEVATAARRRGVDVHVEARPVYLYLDESRYARPDAARYVGMPPLRSRDDVQALWRGLADGSIDTIGSDHAPWTLAQKMDPAHSFATVPKGMAELETFLPLLFTEGVLGGRIDLTALVRLTAGNPARLFGLHPRKGVIREGADADLVAIDPADRRVIDDRELISRAGHSPYEGREANGWPRWVASRGELVLADREVLARPGRGVEQFRANGTAAGGAEGER